MVSYIMYHHLFIYIQQSTSLPAACGSSPCSAYWSTIRCASIALTLALMYLMYLSSYVETHFKLKSVNDFLAATICDFVSCSSKLQYSAGELV